MIGAGHPGPAVVRFREFDAGHSFSRSRFIIVVSSSVDRWTARLGIPCGSSTHSLSLTLIHRTVHQPRPYRVPQVLTRGERLW